MCGICGYISKNRIGEDELRSMNDTMYHRGPNDSGVEIYEAKGGYSIGFAQRRLSILDLSPLGHQPMHSKDKRITVIFNGEIYNFLELKKELSGYEFKSNCDTEVIIAAYLKWGKDFAYHIHGMFAIALYDRETEDVYLVRDRIGKKPLYYYHDGDTIIFGSELKPIIKAPGFIKDINRSVIPRYLYHQYINDPDTIYKNVYKLEPGSVLHYHMGSIKKWKYWDLFKVYAENAANPVTSYEEAKSELKKKLQKAVADRMIADVPLGSFLSGGYDSSLITALAQENSSTPVKTFSIGFDVPEYNEAEYARAVANHLETDHTSLIISEKEMFELVDSIPQYFDEPFADNSEIATMLVSKLAREQVTVALSGDGGDEFFCGYNNYEDVALAQKLDVIGALAYAVGRIGNGKVYDKYPLKVKVIAGNRAKDTKVQFSSEGYIRTANAFMDGIERMDTIVTMEDYLSTDYSENFLPVKYPMESIIGAKNWQTRRMLLDMNTYLPGDILTKVDRASMKYSLESRCPIMDTAVMEYSFRIPHKFKYANGDKKHILKDITYDYLPREMMERPKTGFGVPIDMWLRGPLHDRLIDYSSTSYLKKQGIFDPNYVSAFIDKYLASGDAGRATGANYSKIAWSFYVFQAWYEFYMH